MEIIKTAFELEDDELQIQKICNCDNDEPACTGCDCNMWD